MPPHRASLPRRLTVIFLLVASVGLVALEPYLPIAARVRGVAAHVFAPTQSWLQDLKLSLAGRSASHRSADLRSAPAPQQRLARLEDELRRTHEENVRLSVELRRAREDLDTVRQIVRGLPDYPVALVEANVLSRDYILPDGSLRIAAGGSRGVGRGHWVLERAISRGATSGVAPEQPVLTGDGLVGIVSQVGAHVSQVSLLTSKDCLLSATVVHWDPASGQWLPQGDLNGQLRGAGDGKTMRLANLSRTAQVAPGDYVVTFADGSGLPGHLIVGRVAEASYRETEGTYDIIVVPRVDFDHLDRVFVLSPRGTPRR